MNLILFGGVHGVGKTTLLKNLDKKTARRCKVFDPGKLFWHHVYNQKDKTLKQTEKMVAKKILSYKNQQILLCNWHYAVWTPNSYIPQIDLPRLEKLIQALKPQKVYLVLVTAPAEAVLQRRKKDSGLKKRKIDLACIQQEARQSQIFFKRHYQALKAIAPTEKIVINNSSLVAAVKALKNLLVQIL